MMRISNLMVGVLIGFISLSLSAQYAENDRFGSMAFTKDSNGVTHGIMDFLGQIGRSSSADQSCNFGVMYTQQDPVCKAFKKLINRYHQSKMSGVVVNFFSKTAIETNLQLTKDLFDDTKDVLRTFGIDLFRDRPNILQEKQEAFQYYSKKLEHANGLLTKTFLQSIKRDQVKNKFDGLEKEIDKIKRAQEFAEQV